MQADLELAEGQLTVADATARETCRLADFASRQARRQTELKKSSSTSESIYEEAIVTAEAKKAACQAAQAQQLVARARIDAAKAMIDRTVLTAPFDGIVAEVNGEVGEYVTPSPPGIPTLPAVDLINMDSLYVAAPIDEIDAAQIRPGMDVRITLDAFPKKIFNGKVRSISPYVLEVAKQARTVEIEADFSDKKETANLLVGYSADVEVLISARQNVLKVPTEAIMDGHYLYIVRPGDNRLVRKEFTPGLGNWQYTEAVSGVSQGELVVTTVDRAGLGDGILVATELTPKGK
jgi:HlyD family secretion protein